MQIYLVGGAVRDALLGLNVQDRDWVVVGANPDIMKQQGFQAVGKDFPVFLHPTSHEEYALARTERKTAAGYAGFAFHADESVTLEQDLMRRDLTINAMAQDENGKIIDPFGGQNDLKNKILRHVSPAFAEDPVRILRIARFAARYDFAIAPETMQLMKNMVLSGEINALVAERVWQELSKGLMEKRPRVMIEILRECGALAILLPEINDLFGVPQRAEFHPEIDTGEHTLLVLQRAADLHLNLAERYAALLHDLGKALTPKELLPKHIGHDLAGVEPVRAVNQRWRVPKQCAELAELVCRYHIQIHQVSQIKKSKKIIDLIKNLDGFRRPERFESVLNVCQADKQGRLGLENQPYPEKPHLLNVLKTAQEIDIQPIIQKWAHEPKRIAEEIDLARANAIRALQTEFHEQHHDSKY